LNENFSFKRLLQEKLHGWRENTECITECYGGRYNDVDAMHAMEGGEGNEIMKGLHRDEAFDY
jgi:hypothetical protein